MNGGVVEDAKGKEGRGSRRSGGKSWDVKSGSEGKCVGDEERGSI